MTSSDPPGGGPGPPSGRSWSRLEREIESCRRCSLGELRTHVVVYRGSARPIVVFVGEAPGRREDEEGIPFVGRSGQQLDRAIAKLPLPPDGYGVLNLVKCRPPGNRLLPESIQACRPFLERQLEILRPWALVPLGAKPLAELDPSAPRISEAAGVPRTVAGRQLFPLFHPAASLRSTRTRLRWDDDVERLATWLRAPSGQTL